MDAASSRADETLDVVVVGAGLAGLAAGAVAAREGCSVVVLDAHAPGGRASTVDRDGVLLNEGPHALYRAGAGWRTLTQLGIRPHGGVPAAAAGFGLAGESLYRLPGNARSLLTSGLLSGVSRVQIGKLMARLPRLDARTLTGLTATEWLDSLRVNTDARALLLALMRVSTYVSDPDLVSADVVVSQVQMALGEGVVYLDRGWQQLIDALSGAVVASGGVVRSSTPAAAVRRDIDSWVIDVPGGSVRARAVVLAAGGPAACAGLLSAPPPAWSSLGPTVTAACLDVASTRAPSPSFVLGITEPLYLSQHAPVADLAPHGVNLIGVMRYRAAAESGDLERDRAQLRDLVRRVGVEPGDVVFDRYLHKMVVAYGLPTPDRGGLPGRPSVAVAGNDGAFVAGDWVGPVGWLADASLASAEAAGHLASAYARSEVHAA